MDPFRWHDISNWQGSGYRVAGPIVAKAGEGLDFTDSTFPGFCAQAAAGGWPAYAYYALHTGQPADQARRAASIAAGRPCMFDTEVWPAESGSPAGIASLDELLTAIDTYRAVGGVMHVCYLPRSQWARMGSPDLTPLSSRGIRILNADYRPGADQPTHPAWSPYGGLVPFGVQYARESNVAYCSAYEWVGIWMYGTVPVAAPAPPDPVEMAMSKLPALRIGDTGGAVSILEGLLIGHGYPTASGDPKTVDGRYGPIVAGSVHRFQSDRGLPATGVVDASTWAALLTA